jgi:hypothetical protein
MPHPDYPLLPPPQTWLLLAAVVLVGGLALYHALR